MSEEAEKFLKKSPVIEVFADFMDIFTLNEDATVNEAIELLSNKNISSAPVVNQNTKNVIGSIDLLDLVSFTCANFPCGDNLDICTFEIQEKALSKRISDILNVSGRNAWKTVSYTTSLEDSTALLSQRDCHRIGITNEAGDLVGLVTQSKMVDFLSHHKDLFGEIMTKKVSEIWKKSEKVVSINVHKCIINALNTIVEKNVSGVAVVNDLDELVGNISAGDIKRIQLSPPIQMVFDIFEKIENFLNIIECSNLSCSQCQQKTFMTSVPTFQPVFVTPEDTFEDVLHLLTLKHIHRIYIVTDKKEKKPIGVISLGDVLEQFNKFCEEVNPESVSAK
jgi:CBS domain-containing protein